MVRLSPLMVLPLVVAAGFMGLAWWGMGRQNPDDLPSVFVGRPAPAIGAEALPGIPGVTAADLTGEVTIVNFWASWCPPCRAEHPTLKALAAEGYRVIGVNMLDAENQALAFLAEGGNPFRAIAFDPKGRTRLDWGVTAPPETFILRADGTVAYRFTGPLVGSDYEQRFLAALKAAHNP
ncbi:DsbE family thiol:disulfide interchange protein [Frigidibacter sp. SD6-1]|uniref:DsbE family thiol:disulfide interchange protein n=1 Tax=Frigidibacter sp. SD6-1 TaxID=3032581 RepID=UPI0024DF6F04|nr:DsbE family thiol:disulfide interchange protein [Frigidibacter sp. SD6-1]